MSERKEQIPNFHSHSRFCDGKKELEDYVRAAAEKNQKAFGFSTHAPVPFESWWNINAKDYPLYLKEIKRLKQKYKSKIELYTGIEADYIKGIASPSDFKKDGLDFIIGSIHYLKPARAEKAWDFVISPKTFERGLKAYYRGNIRELIRDYFRASCEMTEAGNFHIIAHCDQIRKFNKGSKYFAEDEKFYRKHVYELLELCAQKDIIVEINTRGRLKNLSDDFYPSDTALKFCKEKGIRIMLSADAHRPEEADSYLQEAALTAQNAGYDEITILKNGKFQAAALSDYL